MTEQDVLTAFGVLECEPGCSLDEVKSSYRQLVQVWHPDRFDSNPKLKIKATEKMKSLNDAFRILGEFFEHISAQNQSNGSGLDSPKPESPEPHTNSKQTASREADYQVGSEKVEIKKEHDAQSGQLIFKKVIHKITGYNGRWLSEQTKVIKTRPIGSNESFESASNHSMSFSLSPEQGRRGSHSDYGGGLGVNEHEGNGNEYLFPDGSSIFISDISTDTWFHDPDKRAANGRTSSALESMKEAHHVFKQRRDWAVCVEIAQRAVDLHGKETWGWIQRSYALHCLGRTRQAFDALKPAVNLFPKHIMIFYNLACYAAQLGNLQDSKRWLEAVFKLAVEDGPYSYAFERYQKMAREDSDLAPIRDAIPNAPISWKVRKYFGV